MIDTELEDLPGRPVSLAGKNKLLGIISYYENCTATRIPVHIEKRISDSATEVETVWYGVEELDFYGRKATAFEYPEHPLPRETRKARTYEEIVDSLSLGEVCDYISEYLYAKKESREGENFMSLASFVCYSYHRARAAREKLINSTLDAAYERHL